jgi:hypothetical protein
MNKIKDDDVKTEPVKAKDSVKKDQDSAKKDPAK